ncbi:MAG: hypothetical protein PHR44_01290 [Candidatus Omnitrophica bacterium]|nr:hypothetical protein [Candidatus Omnitrophota bacterium]
MNNPGDVSPEEKLLRLIKNKPGKRKDEAAPAAVDLSAPAAAGKINFQALAGFDPKIINNVLTALALIFLAYLLADFLFLSPSFRNELQRIKNAAPGEEPDIIEAISPMPYSYYSEQVKGKNLFRSTARRESQAGGAPKKELRELIKDLALIGIIADEEPQAIIEDRATRQSYFLKKGEGVNGLEVAEIKENKVVFEYQGERVDLYL